MRTRAELEAECRFWHPQETVVFLPGDKVRDKRGDPARIFRIKSRTAYRDTELMLMQDVDTRAEQYVVARELVPYLEMVARCLYARAVVTDAISAEHGAIVAGGGQLRVQVKNEGGVWRIVNPMQPGFAKEE